MPLDRQPITYLTTVQGFDNSLITKTVAGVDDFVIMLDNLGTHYKITKSNLFAGLVIGNNNNTGETAMYSQLLEKFPTGNTGGNAARNTWTNRKTNTIAFDDSTSIVIPSEGSFIIPSGTYYINATANFYACHEVKMRLYNLTDNAILLYGSNSYSSGSDSAYVDVPLRGKFIIAGNKTLSLQYYSKNPASSIYNLGTTVGDGSPEIWSIIDLWKLI